MMVILVGATSLETLMFLYVYTLTYFAEEEKKMILGLTWLVLRREE